MRYAIGLGEGVRITPAAYLTALRLALANPTMSFRQSFQDPRGWMGPKIGAEIVQEYKLMIQDRYLRQWSQQRVWGKGSVANRRMRAIHDRQAECKWCGQLTGSASKAFCDVSCSHSF